MIVSTYCVAGHVTALWARSTVPTFPRFQDGRQRCVVWRDGNDDNRINHAAKYHWYTTGNL
jgi:hypothetical protein